MINNMILNNQSMDGFLMIAIKILLVPPDKEEIDVSNSKFDSNYFCNYLVIY